MIDIHHHLLPGTDDGSKDLDTSVAMVQMAARDGITHIVATPHANHTYTYSRERNEELLQQIREALPPETAGRVALGLGCDFHLNFENIEDAHLHHRRYTINETEYLLIELPDFNIPANLGEVLYRMRVDGLTPILTHPERNATLQRKPDMLQSWMDNGLVLQITAGSVTGNFGSKAEAMAWRLLRSGSVHFLATDAHDLERRPPKMQAAHQAVSRKLGIETAELLTRANPLAVFEGRPLPPQAEPVTPTAEGTSFWKRLFRNP